jgi:hypothetical protein
MDPTGTVRKAYKEQLCPTPAQAYCRIRGYLSTLHKSRQALLHALQAVFTGRPFVPALG